VPEGRNVFPLHTVETNLEMGAFIRNDKEGIKADKEYFFDRFPVLKRMRRKLAAFSVGENSRCWPSAGPDVQTKAHPDG